APPPTAAGYSPRNILARVGYFFKNAGFRRRLDPSSDGRAPPRRRPHPPLPSGASGHLADDRVHGRAFGSSARDRLSLGGGLPKSHYIKQLPPRPVQLESVHVVPRHLGQGRTAQVQAVHTAQTPAQPRPPPRLGHA